MKITQTLGKDATQKLKAKDDNEFEENFRPQKSHVNVGTLKNAVKRPESEKKKKPFNPKLLITFSVLVVLLGGAGTTLYFTGFLTPVLQLIGLAPAAGETLTTQEREALLNIREEELNTREEELTKREEKLAAIEAAQGDIPEGMTENTQTFAEMLKGLSEEKLADLKKVSSIYSKMAPAEAAVILSGIADPMEVSAIIYYMQPSASALVLEQMDAKIATGVTQFMLS